ncbi:hypothetical protein AJ80_03099 [Polytolypa hystricis UAMH7299]|uniref:Oxidoreductase acuF-like C2H2 type zinc-finger domain-containing protein n=1 Tax=Polytolypa hystricis (strain UAMH7299) TaxID=1447883 RepID=A0A2B7YK27_POLH7|nr:hypothetical protein AJ80_03099 [Polytolypa hystricis UAMH7299]
MANLIESNSLEPYYEAEVPKDLWHDDLGRLRVWAANIGAHQTNQASLEYRLRDASNIKNLTIKLLETLLETFSDLENTIAEPTPRREYVEFADEDSPEIQQIYTRLVNTINCLYQMSVVIRHPAPLDRIFGTKREDVTPFEPYDRQHVHRKFPQANNEVIDRLGTAISRRRAVLRYRERHHEKLQKGTDRVLADQPDTVSTTLSETVATEFEEKSCPVLGDTGSDSGMTQTSYAETLLTGQAAMSIPPPPKESANGAHFECPYCYYIISIRSRSSWARHIFDDLMPYICILPDCTSPNRLSDKGLKIDCTLCKDEVAAGYIFEKHLARHLEELALFAMPRDAVGENTDSNASGVVNSDIVIVDQSDLSGLSDDDQPIRDDYIGASNRSPGYKNIKIISTMESPSQAEHDHPEVIFSSGSEDGGVDNEEESKQSIEGEREAQRTPTQSPPNTSGSTSFSTK